MGFAWQSSEAQGSELSGNLFVLEPTSQIGNGRVAGDLALQQGTRRKNILHGSLTDEQCLRRALPPGRQSLAHLFPVCEMGSN